MRLPLPLARACLVALFLPVLAAAKPVEALSVALWPRFDWTGSALESSAAKHLGEGDYLILSEGIWNRAPFDQGRFAIAPARVLLQADLVDYGAIEGQVKTRLPDVGGVIAYFEEPAVSRLVRSFCDDAGKLFANIEERAQVRSSTQRRFAAESCHVYVMLHDTALRKSPEKAVDDILEMAQRLRAEEPGLPLWLGLELRLERNDPLAIVDLLRAVADRLDGVMIILRDSPHQTDAALQILETLRPR